MGVDFCAGRWCGREGTPQAVLLFEDGPWGVLATNAAGLREGLGADLVRIREGHASLEADLAGNVAWDLFGRSMSMPCPGRRCVCVFASNLRRFIGLNL